ncbi:hypothetical protein FS837_010392, partial [Tulasnella sp. UAMH 9824]
MTQGDCVTRCVNAGYKFAGMQYGTECWCGSSLNGAIALPDSKCTSKCAGDATQSCGAGYINTLFGLASSVPSYSYQGCYADQNTRTLSGTHTSSDGMTRSLCQLTCGYQGYTYAGLESGNE